MSEDQRRSAVKNPLRQPQCDVPAHDAPTTTERPGSATPRPGCKNCDPDAIAGFAAAGWFGDVILTQSQKSPAIPDELAVTAGLPLGWECTRETLQTRETPPRPNSTEGNEGNKDGSALRFLLCLLFKTSEYNALCTPPNATDERPPPSNP